MVAVAAGLVVVDMLEGSESVVEDMSERRRVHVDVSSEVADEPFLLDSRMMAGQSERKSVAGVPSKHLPKVAMVDQRGTAMVLDAGVVAAVEVQAPLDGSLVVL